MILHELYGSESHPVYQDLHISNGERYYSFLRSIVGIAIAADKKFLSQTVLKAINYHAISCLHFNAGEFRPCPVWVGTPQRECPQHFRVQSLMDDFINLVNVSWNTTDPVTLAAFVLWRLNYIHPFVNGNGRTARAACMFVICVRAGGWLPGDPIIAELLKGRDRQAYVNALQHAHTTFDTGNLDLKPLFDLITTLLNEQLASAASTPPTAATPEHSEPPP